MSATKLEASTKGWRNVDEVLLNQPEVWGEFAENKPETGKLFKLVAERPRSAVSLERFKS